VKCPVLAFFLNKRLPTARRIVKVAASAARQGRHLQLSFNSGDEADQFALIVFGTTA
jgi:hypothetical protein